VCARTYTSAHPPTTLTPAKIEKYAPQKPLSLPMPKHSLPRQQQVLTMKKRSTSNPLLHTHAGVKQTPVIHMHVVERLDSTNKQKCTYTSAYVHPHACVYIRICIHIHRHTYIPTYTNICTCTHTRIHVHTYTYACICTPIHR